MIVHYPASFFSCQSINPDECLTDIEITEPIIIDSIHELSSTAAVGPDGVPSFRLLKCAAELARALKLIFSHSLMVLSLHHLKEQPLPRSSNQVPNVPQLIIGQYHSLLPLLRYSTVQIIKIWKKNSRFKYFIIYKIILFKNIEVFCG